VKRPNPANPFGQSGLPRSNGVMGNPSIVLPDGTPASHVVSPIQISVLSLVQALCQMPPLREECANILRERKRMEDGGEALTLNQVATVKALDMAAGWQEEAKALVIWCQDEKQAAKDAPEPEDPPDDLPI